MGADTVTFQNCEINVLAVCTDLRMVDEGEVLLNPGPNNGVNAPEVSTMFLDGNPVAPGPYNAEEDVSFANESLNISANQQEAAGKKPATRLNLVQWEKLSKTELVCAQGKLARAAEIYKDRPQQLEVVNSWVATVEKLLREAEK
ncbi:hypothetical protein FPANT_250 [Fusarium pseudoanthophilum]|uniref:Uncharacterized protein n=1 Tax=Fusarium pseudoanthophilum TaxID=48495 RepID=A0A8H5V566_9HYPO|nr:hypothetical protein FPANT_250 [Fusarium pseudoanthophilum]